MLGEVILMLWPTINPDGHQMTAEWHMQRAGTAAPKSRCPRSTRSRRPRQRPRRLHAQHDRVAGHGAHLAAVGAEHHLRAPPVGALPDAHLAAAVRRADRPAHSLHRLARAEHDRLAIARKLDAEGKGRTHMGSATTRGIPVTSTTHRRSRTSRPSGPRRRGAAPRRPNPPQAYRRRHAAAAVALFEPVAPRPVDAPRSVEAMKTASLATLDYQANPKTRCSMAAISPARRRFPRDEPRRPTPMSCRRRSGSGGGGRDAAPPGVRRRPRVPVDGG